MSSIYPFDILYPDQRFSSESTNNIPPLVSKIRHKVFEWREGGYCGVSETTKNLLNFWFNHNHDGFSFYFAQREAIESIIYLFEVEEAVSKEQLIQFDSSNSLTPKMFSEDWARYIIKMATGSGKTKVFALVIVWSYFNKLYEAKESYSQNFLVIAPNIMVLNRLLKDFQDLNIFFNEPFIPENNFCEKQWQTDFQPTLHIQDDIKQFSSSGNIFLTNIHRAYISNDNDSTVKERFLGKEPKSNADKESKLDLGKLLRSEKLKDLFILNDEAHHIHDEELAWFKAIQDINNHLLLKHNKRVSLQVDFTATPKHNNGSIFIQTVADFPLVEAIKYNIVKQPVLPDVESRNKLEEKKSTDYVEQYKEYIDLGYIEWKKQYDELKSVNKTPILFLMTTETKTADEVAKYLERTYPILKNAVLTIHTNSSGDINDKNIEELRKSADELDKDNSPYRAVVSVMMLREGWDVKNVTTIVGLRAYSSKSNILPEQTVGRGLRKMFSSDIHEKLVVIGTDNFIKFVEELKSEGVEFVYEPMGADKRVLSPLVVEVDSGKDSKLLGKLDIELPIVTQKYFRDYGNIKDINISDILDKKIILEKYDIDDIKEISFVDIDGNFSHKTMLENVVTEYNYIVGFYTNAILKDNRLVTGFSTLFPKVDTFIKDYLFNKKIENTTDINFLKNLAKPKVTTVIYKVFKSAISRLTITEKSELEILSYNSLLKVKPVIYENTEYIIPKKSVFNKVICDSGLELIFASLIDGFSDNLSFAYNTRKSGGIGFKLDYIDSNNNISEYYPDFFVKVNNTIYIVETKGIEDIDVALKLKRLKIWCSDVNRLQSKYEYKPLLVKQEVWDKRRSEIKSFDSMVAIFNDEV